MQNATKNNSITQEITLESGYFSPAVLMFPPDALHNISSENELEIS